MAQPAAPPDPGRGDLPGIASAAESRPRGSPIRGCSTSWRGCPAPGSSPRSSARHATEDRAVPIGLEQTISQPLMVAVMTAELELGGSERVLEIGTGSGYQTAVLSLLAAEVFTVERLATLSLRARALLDGLGRTNIRYRIGDGSLGWPEEAPFDRVLVTAGARPSPLRSSRSSGRKASWSLPSARRPTRSWCSFACGAASPSNGRSCPAASSN